jgi:nucleoside-triphosphatase
VKIAITGKPGSGKTTLCLRIFERLKSFDATGIVTKEVRESGRRIGFIFLDLEDGEELWLAHVENPSDVRVGKYGVFVENVDRIAEKLREKCEKRQNREKREKKVLIVDEIGPMELKSRAFVDTIREIIDVSKGTLIFTIHLKSKHPLLEKIRREFRVFVIDEKNRNRVLEEILSLVEKKPGGEEA